jgi:glycosyltransferase involved in cell wall biosynthesis
MHYPLGMELKLKILILSYHYQPDLSAGSFRNTALVAELKQQLPHNSKIEVITTLPSRYGSFSVEAPSYEQHDGITIHRIKVPSHMNGMIDQSRAFLVYSYHVMKLARSKQFDLIYASSSRLMTAILAARISRVKNAPLYIDFRDIFVDTIKDILPASMTFVLKPIFSMLEKWAVKRVSKINLVSYGFSDYFQQRYPSKPFSYFTNGIDEEFILHSPRLKLSRQTRKLQVIYAGNIGKGQGLHHIIPALAKVFEGHLEFKIIGDGGQKDLLEAALNANNVTNVELFAPVTRDELKQIYDTADILFLHLNDYDAFRKVLPSKLFEYVAFGKPIWAGVSGYASTFLKNEVTNVALFHPCDIEQATASFHELKIEAVDPSNFIKRYSRKKIMEEMASDILEISKS